MKKYKNNKNNNKNTNLNYKFRRNDYIKANEILVIDNDGNQLGNMTVNEALAIAREQGLDLVEIAPQAQPPVCKIIEWSRFKYEFSKKKKASAKSVSQMKEMWFKPMTDEGDMTYRLKKIHGFLEKKHKVKITVKPGKDRRLDKKFYFEQITKVLNALEDMVEVEIAPKVEGRNVYAIIRSKK